MILSAVCIAGYYIFIYYVICLCIIYIERNDIMKLSQNKDNHVWHKHIWSISFGVMLLCWLPWILMNYPGTAEPDSVSQMMQYLGYSTFTSHHPPLSTFIIGNLFVVGKSIWDANFGFFLYILFQTILGALIFSWSVNKIYNLGCGRGLCVMSILYYALLPYWGGVLQCNGKDMLYAEFAALFVTSLTKIIIIGQCNKKECALFAVLCTIVTLLRNNGIYAVLPTILILLCYLKGVERKRMCVVLCVVSLVYYSITNIIYPNMGIEKGSVKEALSIPFLQTARYVNTYEDEVTEYEKQVIESVIDYEALKTYNPQHADSVKDTYRGDNSKLAEYFKVWFQMFLKHPLSYVSAFYNKGGGYLAPVKADFSAHIETKVDEFMQKIGIKHIFKGKFNGIFVEIEYMSMEMPVLRYFCMTGTYTWIMMLCIMLLLREKIYRGLILFVPEIMNVLVCIASPTWAFRYALPVMAVVPLMLGWTYYLIALKKNRARL